MPTRGGRKRRAKRRSKRRSKRVKRRRGGTRKRFGGDMLKCMKKCRADAKALLSTAKVSVAAAKSMGSNLRSKSAPAAVSALERYKRNAKKSQQIESEGMKDMKKMIQLGKKNTTGITALASGYGQPQAGGRRRSRKRRGSKRRRSKKRRGSKRRRSRRRGSRKRRRSRRRGSKRRRSRRR